MAVVIPYVKNPTWADGSGGGTPVSAAKLNVLEDGLANAHQMAAVRAYNTANQPILTTATWVTIALNSERFDTAGGVASTQHDTVTNNSRLTARYAGKYQITGNVQIESSTAAGNLRGVRIRLNGTTLIGHQLVVASAFAVTSDLILNVTTLYDLAVNDYVELQAYQDSGATRNVIASGNSSPEFMMVRVA